MLLGPMGNIVLFGVFALIGAAVYKVREGDSGAMVYVHITLLLVVRPVPSVRAEGGVQLPCRIRVGGGAGSANDLSR